MKYSNIEIISVNYNTPDLIDRLVGSVIEKEGNYPIHIIDGSDKQQYKDELVDVMLKHGKQNNNMRITQMDYNIHHGRGMDYGVCDSEYEWVMIIDSDNFIIQPTIDKIMQAVKENDKSICAYHCWTNIFGISQGRNPTKEGVIMYYHPALFLIKKDFYINLKENNAGFIHHGAPCIKMMQYLHYNKLSEVVGITLADACGIHVKDYGQYVNLGSRGTVNRFGYNL